MEQNGELAGYLGVDNPPPDKIINIASLLQTLCYFVSLALQHAESQKKLSYLSYHDNSTTFYNRNRYIKDTQKLFNMDTSLGIIYLDVNGLKDVNDQMFADKIMGEGVAFKYNGNTIYSPCKGKIVAVASTKHALGIETEDGIEILIHVGLETAEFNGNGFELLVNQNDKVTIGQPLLKIDRDFFETHHTDLITPVVVTSKGLNIEFTNKEEVTIKDVVMMINR